MGLIRLKVEVIKSWLANKSTPPRTYEEIAEYLNVSKSLFSKMISGIRQVTPNILRKLCDLTGYDIGDICFYDKTANYKKNLDK